jgi:hypothetical protein
MPILFPTSPTLGQVFTSGGRSWVWSGATWDSPTATNTLLAPYGLELIASVTASGSAVQIQNVFSSQYRNYKIFLNLSSTANARIVTELMSGSTLISGNYRINYEFGTTSRTVLTSASTSDFVLQDTGFGANAFFSGEMNLFSPNLAAETVMTYFGMARGAAGSAARPDYQTSVGHHGLSTAYNGISFTMGGTMSGTVQVYGMRN